MFGLNFVSQETRKTLDQFRVGRRVWRMDNLSYFFTRLASAFSLMRREKEILVFALLQWVAIALVYYFWLQITRWIPMEVWEQESYSKPLGIVFALWSFLCVAMAAYPIAILTAAMGASHFLCHQGKQSTVAACLKIALSNSRNLWMFHIADGWLTVDIIVERLPKRGYFQNRASRLMAEAFYYAWKIGTLGMPPALLAGHGLADSASDSVNMVKTRFWDVIRLHGAYSVLCWVVGVSAYIGAHLFIIYCPELFRAPHKLYGFYFWMGVPILIAVAIVQLFIRPIFIILSCELYSDYLKESGRSVVFDDLPSTAMSTLVAFLVLCLFLVCVYLFREPLGLMSILRSG